MTHPDDTRETRLQLVRTYEQAQTGEPEHVRRMCRDAYEIHQGAIEALHNAADKLWNMHELRWAAAYQSRMADLEIQARRHIDAIVQRERDKAAAAKRAAEGGDGEGQ